MNFRYKETPPVLLSPLSSPAPRAVEMEQLYSGVSFLPYAPSKKEIRLATKYEMETIIYPRAIMEYEVIQPVTGHCNNLMEAFERSWIPELGEVTFTMLKYASGLSFEDVLGGCLDAYLNNDQWILARFGMNRWMDKKFYYTSATKLIRRNEAKDPRWLREVYRG